MATAQSVVTAFNSVGVSLENLQRRTKGDIAAVTSAKTRFAGAGQPSVATKLQTVIEAITTVAGLITPLQESLSALTKVVQELPESGDDQQITDTVTALLGVVGEKNPPFVATMEPAHATVRSTVAVTAAQLVDQIGASVVVATNTEKAIKALRKATVAYQAALTSE